MNRDFWEFTPIIALDGCYRTLPSLDDLLYEYVSTTPCYKDYIDSVMRQYKQHLDDTFVIEDAL